MKFVKFVEFEHVVCGKCRQLALKHHPDKVRSGGAAGVEAVRLALEAAAEGLFKHISHAHHTLTNASERRRFDLIELHHQVWDSADSADSA